MFSSPQPRLPPQSPSVHSSSGYVLPPSSPRRDQIPSIQRRVAELFRSGRGTMLLRNSTLNPAPVAAQSNSTDAEAVTPLPACVQIDNQLRRAHALLTIEADFVIKGTVCSTNERGVTIKIQDAYRIDGSIEELVITAVEDLDIKGYCDASELETDIESISVGDRVKAIVISVSVYTEQIYLSMINKRFISHTAQSNPLGLSTSPTHARRTPNASLAAKNASANNPYIDNYSTSAYNPITAPVYGSVPIFSTSVYAPASPAYAPHSPHHNGSAASVSAPSASATVRQSFRDRLMEHAVFRNPQSIHFMTKACQVHEHGSLLGCTMAPANEGYKELRALQNSAWALDSLKRGIAFAKKGGADNWENAIKCYQHAIEVDSKYVDAYTARGAALVLLERYEVAIESFQLALQLRPDDANALRYLGIAREKKQQLDGTCVSLPVISPRSALPATASQVVQLSETLNKEKLAALLLKEEKRERKKHRKEKEKDKDGKHKKKRKHKKDKKKSKKRKHNSSDSSSSSDSESDSGSDDSSSDDDSQ